MKALTAALVFAAVSACAGTAAGFLGGGLHVSSAWSALALGLVAALVAGYFTPSGEKRPFSIAERTLLVVFALFAPAVLLLGLFRERRRAQRALAE